ncbi:MAG: 16S rRNA (guanine(527)-N(7))-methyltransferase RsmG [Nitrospirae bacterium]|uniref:16S rRNA (guanine(527)-N(7))-methyltransferase RsmG n=1 Tax=Candidatus Magnetobacterium casense TaxID=1455061 RepID=UPI00069797AF|nr:16S rRNA (guanine(527)-N(7))-methyltransferase RsmG [Candidatus Magnetobacterium casensis]MBF0337021.1 16S rRNA (guanine(527)-N(7))-methyltransferase RsmG [Nitrospirota bacterium]
MPTDLLPIPILREGLTALAIPAAEWLLEAFGVYLRELKRWSRIHNLTAITEDVDIVRRHFLDSLLYLRCLPPDARSVIDVGSGAGFPGIPMKLVRPELLLCLLEPTGKKVAFLRHMVATLSLPDVTVLQGRVEDIPVIPGGTYDAAVVRSLFSVDAFLTKTAALVKPRGVMILSKGKGYEKELIGLNTDALHIEQLTIPTTDIQRFIITATMPA